MMRELRTHLCLLPLLSALASMSCSSSHRNEELMGNTNWLRACEKDGDCDNGLSCVCGICTRQCTRSADCSELAASCDSDSDALALACGEHHEVSLCLPQCSGDDACGKDLSCVDARCIPTAIATRTGIADSGPPAPGDAMIDAGDAGPVTIDAGFEPVLVGQTDPLPKPRFAFKAGYHDKEQVWLIDEHDEVRQVPTGDISPVWASSCGSGWSTDGYTEGDGRFGPLVFDPSGRYLLFSETIECIHSIKGANPRWRVLVYEVATGVTRVVLETTDRPEIQASSAGVVVYVDHPKRAFPAPQTSDLPPPDVFVFADGGFERVDIPDALGVRVSASWKHVYIEPLGDRALLLADNVVPLERVGGEWQRSRLFDAMHGLEVDAVNAAPTGDRVCGITTRLDDQGRRVESLFWTIDASGTWRSISMAGDFAASSCSFSPDGKRVAFGQRELVFDSATMKRIDPPSGDNVSMGWPIGDAVYGLDADGAIVRVDWSTLESTTVPELAKASEVCAMSSMPSRWLFVPPDGRDLAIIKVSCGCIDCDISGSVVWEPATGVVTTVEEPFQEHAVYDMAWPAGGGAVVLSTQTAGTFGDDGTQETRPERGAFFSIDPDATVRTIGPLDGPSGVLHAPAVPPPANTK